MKRLVMVLAAMLLLAAAALAQELPEIGLTTPREGFAVVAPQEKGGLVSLYAE